MKYIFFFVVWEADNCSHFQSLCWGQKKKDNLIASRAVHFPGVRDGRRGGGEGGGGRR